jgi:chromatin remodeling complex protein RSC6
VREILAGEKLGRVFGKDRVTMSMFEMNRHLARHLA